MTDDARVFLAVYRGAGLVAGAASLGVNHSTVYRRLLALEARCGGQLFDRLGATYVLSALGRELLPAAEQLEASTLAFEHAVNARSERLEGQLRVAVPTEILPLVRREITAFGVQHPDVSIVLDGSEGVDLARGDVDVGIRVVDAPDPRLLGRRVNDVAWAVYGRAAAPPASLPWVVFGDRARRQPVVDYQRQHWSDVRVAFTVDHPTNMLDLLNAADVAGMCPCYLADQEPGLRRLSMPVALEGLWVLYPASMRGNRSVRTFAEGLVKGLAAHHDLFEGARPADPTSGGAALAS